MVSWYIKIQNSTMSWKSILVSFLWQWWHTLTNRQFRRDRVYSAHNSRLQCIVAGKSSQELEQLVTYTINNRERIKVCILTCSTLFSLLHSSGPIPGSDDAHSELALPSSTDICNEDNPSLGGLQLVSQPHTTVDGCTGFSDLTLLANCDSWPLSRYWMGFFPL